MSQLLQERIDQLSEGARDPQGHPGWYPTNYEIIQLCRLASEREASKVKLENIVLTMRVAATYLTGELQDDLYAAANALEKLA